MNLPNKITFTRILLAILIIFILIFPFDSVGMSTTKLFINELIVVDIKYFIAGFLFLIAFITDFLDGFYARKLNLQTTFGKTLDTIADKLLVNSVLIILTSQGLIHPIIPVIVVFRDTLVGIIKSIGVTKNLTLKGNKLNRFKNIIMMLAVTLTLFNNLPFELINIRVSDVLLILGTVLSVYSGIQYCQVNSKIIKEIAN